MNCIFCCVFNQEKYINMFYLLLESIFIYGNLNNTNILVYTSTPFMNIIKQSHLFDHEKIQFEINDTYNNMDKAFKARLDLFNLESTKNYNKILYLDTDIIVKDDINKIFNVCNEDILYVLEEGEINNNCNYWGKYLFGSEINNYTDKTAFTSGILLFNNCEKIKNLFIEINNDIVNRPNKASFYDQPYIVYNAFKYNLYNNKILKSFCVNNDHNINSDKVIHHFPGCPGIFQGKISTMNTFLNNIKDLTINNNISKAKIYINEHLLPIIKNIGELLEGNIFMFHQTTNYTDMFLNKTKNISNLVLNKNIKNVMEIGFNSGFSTLLMLLTNSNMRITCFDLGEHKYTMPCYEKIKETFGDRVKIIIGDSTKTLQNINDKYDLIHIDGGHSQEVANSDIINSYRLSKNKTILIMDDYDFPHLHNLWDSYILKYKLKKLDINLYKSPHHDIKYVVENHIPKVLFQTSKTKPDTYVLNIIKNSLSSEWKYEFYNDSDVIKFFTDNPISDLPDIINKYNSIQKGPHRADLFRYYYLYINGGFFMDSDAMLYVNIDNIVKNYHFVSVKSYHKNLIFQGILGASPKNDIIKKALYNAYNTDPHLLNIDYHYFCTQLYNIIQNNKVEDNIKLYEEKRINQSCDYIFDGDTILFKHYWKNKIIPNTSINNITNWNEYNKSELNNFDYTILNTYKIPNTLVRMGPREDGGYVIADGIDYDLFISSGIAHSIKFEAAFLNIHNIKCIVFDGTIQTSPFSNDNIQWVNKNIGHSNAEDTTNLKEYIKTSKKIFLKMNIAGSEFNWLDSITEAELNNFSQIVIQVHWPFDIYRMNMLKKLNETHYIIHIHGNNYCDRDIPKHLRSGRTYDGTVTINNPTMPPIKLPEVFQVTYINKNLCNKSLVEIKEIKYPTILDCPNNPNALDISFSIPVIN